MNPAALASIYIAAIAILLLFSGFFSCCDMTFAVVNPKKLRKKGTKNARLAAKMAENYKETIVTVLFVNNLVNILASSLGAALSRVDLAPFNNEYSAVVIEAVMLILILTFGEILPKVIGRAYSFRLATLFARPVTVLRVIFFPFVKPATWVASKITGPILKNAPQEDQTPSDDELQAMVDTIEEEGIIDEDQSELLSRSIQFKDTSAREVMTPRVRIEGIERSTNLAKFFEKNSFSHSRIPVYEKDLDHIVGYLPVKALYRAILSGKKLSLDDLTLPILAVPATLEVSTILSLMKKSHRHIALVKDEFGGTAGILTLEDILEELVGDMWDESELVKEDVTKLEKRNAYLVKGSMEKYAFFDRFELDEESLDEDYTTVSGWINDKLGRFAKEGDKFSVSKIDVLVKKASPYTVEEIVVTYHPRRKSKD